MFADSGDRGVEKQPVTQDQNAYVDGQIAMMSRKAMFLTKTQISNKLTDQLGMRKTCFCTKVGRSFRAVQYQFRHRKTRYRELTKNTSQLMVMFALSNLWMVRKRMMQGLKAAVRVQHGQWP